MVSGFLWLFFSDSLYEAWLREKWLDWFGGPWYSVGPYALANALIAFLPMVLAVILALYWGAKFSMLNSGAKHRVNLLALSNARIALQQGLASLDTIEQEYKHRLTAFERLQKDINELESVRGIDVDDLRKKLSALSHANRRSIWFERSLGFVLGVVGSLVATVIWEARSLLLP